MYEEYSRANKDYAKHLKIHHLLKPTLDYCTQCSVSEKSHIDFYNLGMIIRGSKSVLCRQCNVIIEDNKFLKHSYTTHKHRINPLFKCNKHALINRHFCDMVPCPFCKYPLYSPQSLFLHRTKHHEDKDQIQCANCADYSSCNLSAKSDVSGYIKHYFGAEHTKNSIVCPVCEQLIDLHNVFDHFRQYFIAPVDHEEIKLMLSCPICKVKIQHNKKIDLMFKNFEQHFQKVHPFVAFLNIDIQNLTPPIRIKDKVDSTDTDTELKKMFNEIVLFFNGFFKSKPLTLPAATVTVAQDLVKDSSPSHRQLLFDKLKATVPSVPPPPVKDCTPCSKEADDAVGDILVITDGSESPSTSSGSTVTSPKIYKPEQQMPKKPTPWKNLSRTKKRKKSKETKETKETQKTKEDSASKKKKKTGKGFNPKKSESQLEAEARTLVEARVKSQLVRKNNAQQQAALVYTGSENMCKTSIILGETVKEVQSVPTLPCIVIPVTPNQDGDLVTQGAVFDAPGPSAESQVAITKVGDESEFVDIDSVVEINREDTTRAETHVKVEPGGINHTASTLIDKLRYINKNVEKTHAPICIIDDDEEDLTFIEEVTEPNPDSVKQVSQQHRKYSTLVMNKSDMFTSIKIAPAATVHDIRDNSGSKLSGINPAKTPSLIQQAILLHRAIDNTGIKSGSEPRMVDVQNPVHHQPAIPAASSAGIIVQMPNLPVNNNHTVVLRKSVKMSPSHQPPVSNIPISQPIVINTKLNTVVPDRPVTILSSQKPPFNNNPISQPIRNTVPEGKPVKMSRSPSPELPHHAEWIIKHSPSSSPPQYPGHSSHFPQSQLSNTSSHSFGHSPGPSTVHHLPQVSNKLSQRRVSIPNSPKESATKSLTRSISTPTSSSNMSTQQLLNILLKGASGNVGTLTDCLTVPTNNYKDYWMSEESTSPVVKSVMSLSTTSYFQSQSTPTLSESDPFSSIKSPSQNQVSLPVNLERSPQAKRLKTKPPEQAMMMYCPQCSFGTSDFEKFGQHLRGNVHYSD